MKTASEIILLVIACEYALCASSDRGTHRKIIDTVAFVATLTALVLINIFAR